MITGGGSSSSRGGRPSQDIHKSPKPVSSTLAYFNCILDGGPSKIIFRASIKTEWWFQRKFRS